MKESEAREMREAAAVIEGKARRIFGLSLSLNMLIVLYVGYSALRTGGLSAVTWTFLVAVLLWSLMVTAYAFHMLSSLSRHIGAREGNGFTDLSTGVFALPYLKSYLEQERRRAEQTGKGAAVVYVDMVDLDRANRVYGHTIGDIVLKAIAQLIADNVRSGDVVGRVGGDEFLVIMPETDGQTAEPLIKAISDAVAGYRLDLGKRGMIDFLGCLAGVAFFPLEGDSPEAIIAVARQRTEASRARSLGDPQ